LCSLRMDNTTRNIFTILSILVVVSIFLTYDRAIIRKDYIAFPPEPEQETASLEEGASPETPSGVEPVPPEENTSTAP